MTLFSCAAQHELNADVLASSIDAIGNFIKTPQHAEVVAKDKGMETVLKVLKSQDFNPKLAFKSERVLLDMLAHEGNIDNFLHSEGCPIVNNLLTAQTKDANIVKNVR